MIPLAERILIIDGSPDDRASCRQILSAGPRSKRQFIEAATAAEGLRLCGDQPPDCVIVEYRLPDQSGIDVVKQLHEADEFGARTPVIMLTGSGNERVAAQAIKAGATEYLVKSEDAEQLRVAVQLAIEKRLLPQRIERSEIELARLSESEAHAHLIADAALKALQESEERFRTMANAMPQLAWIARPDGNVYWYNDRWYQYTGSTPDQMEGWGWRRVHDPAILPSFLERWNHSIATGQPFEMEFPLLGADGKFRTFLTRIEPFKDAQGRIVQWFGTNTDVTELHQSEAMRLALTGAAIGTWHWNVVTGELSWSDQCKRIFGISLDTTMSYPRFLASVHPDDRTRVDSAVSTALECRSDFELEFRSVWPDGSLHWAMSKGRGFYDADGHAVRMEGAALEITQRKQTEQRIASLNDEVERRTKEIQEANKDLEAFAYSVSHDLRAPLRAIDGFSKIVLTDFAPQLPEAGQEYLQSIRQSTRQMGKLVDDLLKFSRLGRQAIQKQLIDTNALVARCWEELNPGGRGRQIEFRIVALPSCDGDPALLKQVWVNLLSNAVKYTAKQSHAVIEVGSQSTDTGLEYFVKDNGVGFDMRYAHKLFGVFQRLHRVEDYEGTGVGLAIVKRIIHRHGGHIRAEAQPNAGATFFFGLPRQGAASC